MVAPAIASYEEYGKTMAMHLLEVKLRHWEASIRDLAARGLAKLVFLLPETLSGPGLDYLTSMCTSNTLEVRRDWCQFMPTMNSHGIITPKHVAFQNGEDCS